MPHLKAPESIILRGPCSEFGGPADTGVAPGEGLAMFPNDRLPDLDDPRRKLFLPAQPVGTKGLARRLDPKAFYAAIRYPFGARSKLAPDWRKWLGKNMVELRANGNATWAYVVDFGPAAHTGRTADLSPGLAKALGLETDELCEIILNRGL